MRRYPIPAIGALAAFGLLWVFVAFSCGHTRWNLVWHDEFQGQPNTAPDATKWAYDIGEGGWGNHELQRYTSSIANVFLDGNGNLVIRALNDEGGYTSGRVKTQGKFSFIYGKVEAKIRIPYAQGIWPALWMLGDAFPKTPWPKSGEIDIMENFGPSNNDASTTHAALHGPGYSGRGLTGKYNLPDGNKFGDGFHVFSIEWSENNIQFFVDGNRYMKVTPENVPSGSEWVFNAPYFILLNVAVGGSPAPVGYPDSTTIFPQDMLVDYVRVYQRSK